MVMGYCKQLNTNMYYGVNEGGKPLETQDYSKLIKDEINDLSIC
jgi:hypothetical protein